MVKTLYAKLALVLAGILSLMAILYLLLAFYSTGVYLREVKQRLNRDLARNLVTENILMIDGGINRQALEGVFHDLMVINPSVELYLLGPDGTVLAFSAPPGKVKRSRVSLAPVSTFLSGRARLPIEGDDPRDPAGKKIFSVYPISAQDSEGPQGYLYIILGGTEYDSVLGLLRSSYMLRLSVVAIAGLMLFALVTGLVVFRLLTKRLRRLSDEMDAFRQSGFVSKRNAAKPPGGVRTGGSGGDEIDRLGAAFSEMSERIAGQVERLKQADNLRRELVANVSHDLRTPLASMQGYIETLLVRGERLSDEERRSYLATAASHGERLGKMVGELFELSKLNSRETEPEREPFALAELVGDVCQKFRLTAEKKRITLKTDLPEDLPFVYADIGLMERVLVNLLDNAWRFTPEGGGITIALAPAADGVTVRVSDTGPGIPAEELPYIFDRFYRVHAAPDKAGSGTGLGLAIAKRIVELHGSTLEVESEPGSGATFFFTLPLHTT